jgi:hypothetical protein
MPEHFQPSPARPAGPARPAHGPYWTGLGSDLAAREKILAKARPEMLFLAILHYKKHGRPAQARVRPEPDPKNEARSCPLDGRGQDFFGTKNPGIFSARPGPAR